MHLETTFIMKYAVSALIITFIIPSIGIVIGMIRKIVYGVLAWISPMIAFVIANYLTFPGVIHHELSHALLGFVSGAKITRINLFKPDGTNLGSVQMVYRGPWILRCIQGCLSAIGPVALGLITICILDVKVLPVISGSGALIFLYYLMFSIAMHMTMSKADMFCFFKGVLGVYLIVLAVCILTETNVMEYIG